ncbi:unannotated protein [freshwater metagenome]|uniref:Unannotated protein n=1 Tax=freshwater metagenome TaxID=449393 RepID=A0A6J7Y035_9ZZZZ|nr:amidohydrolase family protein [Actinomycetota bacterium]
MSASTEELREHIEAIKLTDHHVHGVVRENPTPENFANMITESDRTPKSVHEAMETQVGFATRRWCAPLLGLAAHASADEYFARRIELGSDHVNRTLLTAAGISHYLIETGYRGDEIHGVDGMRELTGSKVDEVIRLETLAQFHAETSGTTAQDFSATFATFLAEKARTAVGLKSIAAYRIGLDFDPTRPSELEVRTALGQWFQDIAKDSSTRLMDPIIIRHVIWQGIDLGLPIQFHIGYGDPDLNLHKCDPLLMTELIRMTEKLNVPIMLLHNYPYQRNAGYLAQMFRNVFIDVGLAINYAGARSPEIIAESLELAPFRKILFSSDAWGLPELTYLGTRLFRNGLTEVLGAWVDKGEWSLTDAKRVSTAIGTENSIRAYSLKG